MKQKIIGVYDLGYHQIQLVLREGTGGDFFTAPEKGSLPRIKVGADTGGWRDVVAVLLHEAMEYAMFSAGARFDPNNRITPRNSADYLFVMDHQVFHDCATRCADFLCAAMPDLQIAWTKWTKAKRK